MKKMYCLIILILFAVPLSADFTIEQTLIDSLNARAIKNIEPLPEEAQSEYRSLLESYPAGLMAYLISTEKSGILWDANPEDILANYLVLEELFDLDDFDKYPDEFVLSYIAKTTVSHEKITNYRKVFFDLGLLEYVARYPDLAERIRQITLWTRENMTFVSTSGRTQDPLSVLQKSNIGRCGEMQVFYIAALRMVGIPARPAWTPWWAHTDNNHAWTEMFLDGKWQYAENTSPTYNLNTAWFSASTQKALLILARSSFPDSTDDVVSKGKNNNYVNSTRYYQDTRVITLNIFDEEHKPVKDAKVNICAFNFSMFRPLLELSADTCGIAKFTIGQGGFLTIAFKDSLFDYLLVPYDENSRPASYDLTLRNQKWQNFDYTLEYPIGKAENKENPEEFNKIKKRSEEKYDELIKQIQATEIPEYAPKEDSVFVEIFENCRNNKSSLLKFIAANDSIPLDFWSKLSEVDVKFLWQANFAQFQNIYDTFLHLKQAEISDDDFSNLLSPNIFYEKLPLASVPENYIFENIEEHQKKIHTIIDGLHSHHKIDKDKAVSGLLSLDKMLQAEYLQNFHFKMLSCYVLQANLIPAQYTRIPSVIMVKADSVWQNYDIVKNDFVKPQDKESGRLIPIEFTLVDKEGYPVTMNPDNISVTIFQDGRFYYNDRQLDYDKEFSKLTGELENGDYQIQFCIRESGEVTKTKLIALDLSEQDEICQTLIFQDFKRNWKNADAKYRDFISSFTDKESDWVVLLGNYDLEPPQRLATKIRENIENQKFVWIGNKTPIRTIPDYIASAEYENFLNENPELKNRLITFYYDNENDKWKIFDGNFDMLYK
ncbi:MAG: transglutaminase-like domain-containing protein, partial [Candidatus Cloacimonadota bacterium]|nr:transglutaminase-like domain-containing protein [Candidatus Cloacimonadota bacterium]